MERAVRVLLALASLVAVYAVVVAVAPLPTWLAPADFAVLALVGLLLAAAAGVVAGSVRGRARVLAGAAMLLGLVPAALLVGFLAAGDG